MPKKKAMGKKRSQISQFYHNFFLEYMPFWIGCFTRRDFWPSSGQKGPKKYAALILASEAHFSIPIFIDYFLIFSTDNSTKIIKPYFTGLSCLHNLRTVVLETLNFLTAASTGMPLLKASKASSKADKFCFDL